MNREEWNRLSTALAEVEAALVSEPGSADLRRQSRALRKQIAGAPSGVVLQWRAGRVVGVTLSVRRRTEAVLVWLKRAWVSPVFEALESVEISRCTELSAVLAALSGMPASVTSLSISAWDKRRQEPAQSIDDLSAIQDHPGLSALSIRARAVCLPVLRLPALKTASIAVQRGSEAAVASCLPEGVALAFHSDSGGSQDEDER